MEAGVESDLSQQFVNEKVTREKFERQVSTFIAREDEYRKNGIICLKKEFPVFEFAFISKNIGFKVPHLSQPQPEANVPLPVQMLEVQAKIPSVRFAVRIDYSNYDTVPPSLRIIDPLTSELSTKVYCEIIITPAQQDQNSLIDVRFKSQNQNILMVDQEGKLFICLRGLREYHNHPQHTGDSWFLHKDKGMGDI